MHHRSHSISPSRKEPCKSMQMGTACLAFSYNFSHVPLAFTRYCRMHILGAHVRHTPRVQSLLQFVSPFPSTRPTLSIMIGATRLLPRPPRHGTARRVLSAFQPALHQFKVRALDLSLSLSLSLLVFNPPFVLLSFAPLPRVCLLRSLVGIIPRQGNYRYPEPHNATPTHVYN